MIKKFIESKLLYAKAVSIFLISPIAYFAPLGEWLILSLISISSLAYFLLDKFKIHFKYILFFMSTIFIVCLSYFWSINQALTLKVIGPVSGIILAIFITLFISKHEKIMGFERLIGIPLIITSICILFDLVLNTEIRSTLAKIAGDEPTSLSGNYGRGIIVLNIIMPISMALFLNYKNKLMAIVVFLLVSTITWIGPNETAKITLICSYLSMIIIYFLGPRVFYYFGIVSFAWILFIPITSIKFIPSISNFEYKIEKNVPCAQLTRSAIVHNFSYYYENKSKLIIIDDDNLKSVWNINTYSTKIKPSELIEAYEKGNTIVGESKHQGNDNDICTKKQNWQELFSLSSIIHRFLVWEYVGAEILKKPLLGNGIGTSRVIGQKVILKVPRSSMKSESEEQFRFQEIKGAIPLHPHNNFLEIWLELGLIGIIMLLIIWTRIIKYGINLRKKSYYLGTGYCTSIVSIFIVANLSFGFFQAWWMSTIALVFLIIINSVKSN
jgi:hypothetical protein